MKSNKLKVLTIIALAIVSVSVSVSVFASTKSIVDVHVDNSSQLIQSLPKNSQVIFNISASTYKLDQKNSINASTVNYDFGYYALSVPGDNKAEFKAKTSDPTGTIYTDIHDIAIKNPGTTQPISFATDSSCRYLSGKTDIWLNFNKDTKTVTCNSV